MHTHQQLSEGVATIGLDIRKNTSHLVGLDKPLGHDVRLMPARTTTAMPRRSPRRCSD